MRPKKTKKEKEMGIVTACVIGIICIMIAFYECLVKNVSVGNEVAVQKNPRNWLSLSCILFLGLVVRYVCAKFDSGYAVDMGCFSYWADSVYKDGFGNFYNAGTFADYPPGYMYILWIVGLFRHLIPGLSVGTVALKMPAMLCDLATGALIYKLARKRFNEKTSLYFVCLYIFNPVMLMDSAMWGQVDSIFTLCLAIMITLVAEKKLIPAYYVFALGILIKPQTLVLTPILILAIIDQVILHDFSVKRFFKHLGLGLLAIFAMYICVLPFDFDVYWVNFAADPIGFWTQKGMEHPEAVATFLPTNGGLVQASSNLFVRAAQAFWGVVTLYAGTLVSYEKVTVNAYNFWEVFKLNWHSQSEVKWGLPCSTWGTIFVVLICLLAVVIFVLNRKRENPSKYFILGAMISIGFFTFSVRVHERYMFPAFILLLLAYLYQPRKQYFILYVLLTVTQSANIWHAFKFYTPEDFDWEAWYPQMVAIAHMLVVIYATVHLIRDFIIHPLKNPTDPEIEEKDFVIPSRMANDYWAPRASEKKTSFTKYDWISILAITIIYGAIALFNLGDKDAPMTYWESQAQGDCITLNVSNKTANLTKMWYYNGRYEGREFYLEESADGMNWTSVAVNGQDINTLGAEAAKFQMNEVFKWNSIDFYSTQPFLRLRCNSAVTVTNELIFHDETGAVVQPANAAEYSALFDEAEKLPEASSYRDSTYFDEIYHARTAYEMVQGVYNYEWTHPPLGKFIMSLGIWIYGMCPFGWRIMGTLIGIAMLPIFYLFSKRMFGKTWLATVTTVLFAADFMHFAQTRIATIDVYVTLFIILMYYFMYQYYIVSFYDRSLKKTFIPLLCCGISMGLGCASKWPGVYAGLGLAVVFFAAILRRFMEYRYALKDPEGESNGILHQDVINGFARKTIKTLAFCLLAFVMIPVTIYTLSYIPFSDDQNIGMINFSTKTEMIPYTDNTEHEIITIPHVDGVDTTIDKTYCKMQKNFQIKDVNSFTGKLAVKFNDSKLNQLAGKMLRNQKAMFDYHAYLEAEHPYQSTWYEWPIMKRPILYYCNVLQDGTGRQECISSFGNPMIWWGGILGFVAMIVLWIWKRERTALFLVFGFLAELIPWTGIARCTFIYHYFPSVSFITLMIGYVMYTLWKYCKKEKTKKAVFIACCVYAALAVVLFIMFYPVISGYPVNVQEDMKWLIFIKKFLKSWVLVGV